MDCGIVHGGRSFTLIAVLPGAAEAHESCPEEEEKEAVLAGEA
jgi:hypothetical protein